MWASVWKLCEGPFSESHGGSVLPFSFCLGSEVLPFWKGRVRVEGWDNQRFWCTAFLCAMQFQKHQEIQTFPPHASDT